jgi:hypothetical protein
VNVDCVLPGEGGTGDRLWALVLDDFDLSHAERVLLARACSALNRADHLEIEVAEQGLIDPETGKTTPAAVELRLVGQEAAKLLAGLRFPVDDEDEGAGEYNPTAPRGPRGPYGAGRLSDLRAVDGGRT